MTNRAAAGATRPVFSEHQNSVGGTYKAYTICEIYLDTNGRLEGWTDCKAMAPNGETIEELTDDLKMMLKDISAWKPVSYDSLTAGMTFEQNAE